MSGVLLADDFLREMDQPSSFMQGFISSVYTLGCLVGPFFSFFFFLSREPIYLSYPSTD